MGVSAKKESDDFCRIAIEWLKKAAELGDAKCQLTLAEFYEKGQYVNQNFKLAMFWYEKAESNGSAEGSYRLGRLYEKGLGVQKNIRKALSLYQKARKDGCIGETKAFDAYDGCIGLNQSEGEIKLTPKERCENGVKALWINNGMRQEYAAFKNFQVACEMGGYADAFCFIGNCYENGTGTDICYGKAIECYEKGVSEGSSKAFFSLVFLNLLVMQKEVSYPSDDITFHLNNILKEAKNDDVVSQYIYGKLCELGSFGIEKDLSLAFKWYTVSADNGFAPSQYSLAYFYYNGEVVDQNVNKAKELWRKAMLQGVKEAKSVLIGVEKQGYL